MKGIVTLLTYNMQNGFMYQFITENVVDLSELKKYSNLLKQLT